MVIPRTRSPRTLLALLFAGATAACGIKPSNTLVPANPEGTLISRDEIRDTGASNAWDVIRRAGTHIRMDETAAGMPARMVYRGKSSILLNDAPILVIDGARSRDFRVLHLLPAADLHSIQILTGRVATQYHGTDAAGGAVVIQTRTGPDDD